MIPNKILSWLLHNANTKPTFVYKNAFYEIKDAMLKKHGQNTGAYDLQHIQKECWTCHGTGEYPYPSHWGKRCLRCGGTGLYTDFWVKLDIWQFGKYEFHLPKQRMYGKTLAEICINKDIPEKSGRKIIDDYISHRTMVWSTDSCLILFLLYKPELFWKAFGRIGFSRKTPVAILFNIGFKLNPRAFYIKIKYRAYKSWRRLYWEIKHHKDTDAWNPYNDDSIPF